MEGDNLTTKVDAKLFTSSFPNDPLTPGCIRSEETNGIIRPLLLPLLINDEVLHSAEWSRFTKVPASSKDGLGTD